MIEFTTLIILILTAFLFFQKYIVRGITGRWKIVGDSLGQGMIYDPEKTIECSSNVFFDGQAARWYNRTCFDANCYPDCLEVSRSLSACETCITGCMIEECND